MTIQVDLPADAQIYFDHIRNKYFPKHKLKDQAHLTLIYQIHLPAETIINKLNTLSIAPLELNAEKVKAFAYGNAIAINSPEIKALQKSLKKLFNYKIAKRDHIKYKPHITVQLDVTAFKAQQTFEAINQEFKPFTFSSPGISLWKKDNKEHICLWKSY